MMYEYCAKRGVKHQQVGKLLVAADEKQVARLKHYIQNGAENKVELRVGSSLPLFRLAKTLGFGVLVFAIPNLHSSEAGIVLEGGTKGTIKIMKCHLSHFIHCRSFSNDRTSH
jgi:L-2-hydroxyglutarate oxidase LhgO